MSRPASQALALGARLAGAALVLAITGGQAVDVPAQLALLTWLAGLMAASELVRSSARLASLGITTAIHSLQAPPRPRAISQEAPI